MVAAERKSIHFLMPNDFMWFGMRSENAAHAPFSKEFSVEQVKTYRLLVTLIKSPWTVHTWSPCGRRGFLR